MISLEESERESAALDINPEDNDEDFFAFVVCVRVAVDT